MGYRAFFSYARADERVANWLHGELDRYRTPKGLAGADGLLGPVPAKLHPIFRDRTDLQAGGHVDGALQHALEASETLVVLCTPTSAKSQWVNHECETFLKLGRETRIFPVIVAGEPNSADPALECFPPALRDKGLLAADLREIRMPNGRMIGDGREGGRLKLIAGLLGVELDALLQRERRRQRLLRLGLSSAAIVFALLAAVAVWQSLVANQQANVAAQQRDAAQLAVSRIFVERAWAAQAARRPQLSAKYALAALAISPAIAPEVRAVLAATVQDPSELSPIVSIGNAVGNEEGARIIGLDRQGAHAFLAVPNLDDTDFSRIDLASGASEPLEGLPASASDARITFNDPEALLSSPSVQIVGTDFAAPGALVRDPATGAPITLPAPVAIRLYQATISSDASTIAGFGAPNSEVTAIGQRQSPPSNLYVWRRQGDGRWKFAGAHANENAPYRTLLSADGQFALLSESRDQGGELILAALAEEPSVSVLRANPFQTLNPTYYAFSDDGRSILTLNEQGALIVWDAARAREIAQLPRIGRTAVNFARFHGPGRSLMVADENAIYRWRPAPSRIAHQIGYSCACDSPSFSGSVQYLNAPSRLFFSVHGDGFIVPLANPPSSVGFMDYRQRHPQFEVTTFNDYGADRFQASQDGRIAVTPGARLCVLDVAGAVRERRCIANAGHLAAISADGRAFAGTSGSSSRVAVYDAQTLQQTRAVSLGRLHAKALALSADGVRLAIASDDGDISIWRWSGAVAQQELRIPQPGVVLVRFLQGGRIIAADTNGAMQVWDLRSGALVRRLTGHVGEINVIAESRSGNLIASGGSDHTARVWDMAVGREVYRLSFNAPVGGLQFNGTSQELAIATDEDNVDLVDIALFSESLPMLLGSVCSDLLDAERDFTAAEIGADDLLQTTWMPFRSSSGKKFC